MKLQTNFDLIDYDVNRNLSKNVFVKRQKKNVKKFVLLKQKLIEFKIDQKKFVEKSKINKNVVFEQRRKSKS